MGCGDEVTTGGRTVVVGGGVTVAEGCGAVVCGGFAAGAVVAGAVVTGAVVGGGALVGGDDVTGVGFTVLAAALPQAVAATASRTATT
jgi:hypothetical protein